MESYQFREKGPKGSKIIFETGQDVIPATVKEQRLFHLKWSNKIDLRKLNTMMKL